MTTTKDTITETREVRHGETLLEVRNVTMDYVVKEGRVSAVNEVSFELKRGSALGLVGESGCGKTSIALTLLRLQANNAEITQGQILLGGLDLLSLPEEEMRRHRWNDISMVFQGAMNAWNPVYRIGDQIREAMDIHWPQKPSKQEARDRIAELFALVGLPSEAMDRYPHEYSGGMRQRATIAMALSCNPQLIIADEPTTALDVIVQDQILKELKKVQSELGMSIIYISHDIAVIAQVTEHTGVMYAGKMVEYGTTPEIFARPRHPYAWLLLSSTPSITGPRRKLAPLVGEPPDLMKPPSGCRFHPRCPFATERCTTDDPPMEDVGGGHLVACWNHDKVPVGLSETAAEEI